MKHRTPQEIVAAFPGTRVLVIGDVMLDEYIWGEVRRISPEAPVPVVEARRRTYIPGGAGNTAANVVSLGGQAVLGGVVGRDHQATKLGEALQQNGIETAGLVVDEGRPTTTKTRIVAHSQQVVRVDCEEHTPLPARLEDTLLQWAETYMCRADACILSDYNKGVVSTRLATCFIHLARQAGRPVVVDPKGTDYTKYRGATVVTPNVYEVEQALDHEINGDGDFLGGGQRLLDILDGAALLITRGAQGMSLYTKGAPTRHIPANARNVYDVTGAGDTVVGMLALALAAGATLEQAMDLANRAAGIVVGKFGTAMVSLAELSDHIAMAQL
jgi:D-beta-D-heptose 7-phosphate kinase/D-beta-D-heptose 1-phosphate adenosyltransferase